MRDHQRENRVGIIGGGQLGLMLADAASRLGFKPIVLTEHSDDPAAFHHNEAILGSWKDPSVLERLFSQVKRVVFENEFIDCDLLRQVGSEFGIEFIPDLPAISLFQDKLKQKQLLKSLNIPTADFFQCSDSLNLEGKAGFEKGAVLKWARMGYDGKGVLFLNSETPSDQINNERIKIQEFFSQAQKRQSAVYAEQYIPFKRELAVIAVYSRNKEFKAYPLMISEQKRGICSVVYGPATALGVSPEQEQKAWTYARQIAESANLVGTFAIEFFETINGSLIVNEIAPRVHNSGHYTQNSGMSDQFENHWRAVLGWPLGTTLPRSGAMAMVNLLGPSFPVSRERAQVRPVPGPRGHLHWYSKRDIRPERKVGHLNGSVKEVAELPDLLQELKGSAEAWVELLAEEEK